MPKLKHTPKLHLYLAEKGLLHTSNIALKEAATKAYWNEYYRNWQKEKRAREHSYRIYLNKEEQRLFALSAKFLNLNIVTLIKQSAIAYVSKKNIRNNSEELQAIKQILTSASTSIIYALDEERITEQNANLLLEKLDCIQGSVEAIAHNTSTNDYKSFK